MNEPRKPFDLSELPFLDLDPETEALVEELLALPEDDVDALARFLVERAGATSEEFAAYLDETGHLEVMEVFGLMAALRRAETDSSGS